MSSSASAMESGSSTQRTARVMSTQKLPISRVAWRVNPRMRATATVMPTAAEMKCCQANPAICVR